MVSDPTIRCSQRGQRGKSRFLFQIYVYAIIKDGRVASLVFLI